MKCFIDMNHPADVHFFHYTIKELNKKGSRCKVTARGKEITHALLHAYSIPFIPRKGYCGIQKLPGMFSIDRAILKQINAFGPDILLGGPGNCYIAQAGFVKKIPSIIFDDTEHSSIQNYLTFPFASLVCTPDCFQKSLGKKQVSYRGYKELAYLHPARFRPDRSVLRRMALKKGEAYFIVRFVSWEASHDLGKKRFSLGEKRKLIKFLSKLGSVYISSESELPRDLKKYELVIPPEEFHSALSFAAVYVGEGATMAAEAAVLGTPAIYTNSLTLGYIDDLKKYGLVYQMTHLENIKERLTRIAKQGKEQYLSRREHMLKNKIDVTSWIIGLLEGREY